SGAHTFTTPCRVPNANPGEPCACSPNGASPTTRSSRSNGASSRTSTPSRNDTVPDDSGSTGNGNTSVLNARPRLVTNNTWPRAVVCTMAAMASCRARPLRLRPSTASSDSAAVRATNPVDDRITWHGSSATSNGPAGLEAANTSFRSPSINAVRRGTAKSLATLANSFDTTRLSTFSSSRSEEHTSELQYVKISYA